MSSCIQSLTHKGNKCKYFHNYCPYLQVKLGIYRDGQEGAFVVFDANGTDKNSWFNSSLLLKSSYTDLDTTIRTKFSLQG